ncbi:MAG: DNA-processing protein DprA [Muribaculaceae bacterium]|nr:DNA-processing protein DprA [Muribaculaceae bacterium]
MDANETTYRLAFSMLRGINTGTAAELLRRIGTPEAFFTLDSQALQGKLGVRADIADDSYRSRLVALAVKELDFIRDNNISTSFFNDSDYPARLRECPDAPVILYKTGTAALDPPRSIAIVGTRHATAFGTAFVSELVQGIKEIAGDVTIISGLAYGIDIAAHRAALQCGLPTLAVVAHGLKMIYPAEHRSDAARIAKNGGAVVTEYISTASPNRGAFLARNRIVAGLADAVIVVESDSRGGALCTARIASEYNREVFAVPGRPCDTYSRGCNRLITNNAARMLTDAAQLVDALGWPQCSQPQQTELFRPLAPLHQKIIDHLRLYPESTVNELAVHFGMPFASLSSTLFEMEMADLILTLPGGRIGVISN